MYVQLLAPNRCTRTTRPLMVPRKLAVQPLVGAAVASVVETGHVWKLDTRHHAPRENGGGTVPGCPANIAPICATSSKVKPNCAAKLAAAAIGSSSAEAEDGRSLSSPNSDTRPPIPRRS